MIFNKKKEPLDYYNDLRKSLANNAKWICETTKTCPTHTKASREATACTHCMIQVMPKMLENIATVSALLSETDIFLDEIQDTNDFITHVLGDAKKYPALDETTRIQKQNLIEVLEKFEHELHSMTAEFVNKPHFNLNAYPFARQAHK